MPLRIDFITIFPDMLSGFTGQSMMKRAQESGAVSFRAIDLRSFSTDKHRTVDDRPFGGGPGMLLKPEPLAAAIESVRQDDTHVIYLSPSGGTFTQKRAEQLTRSKHLVFVCGHYEGIDQRIIDTLVDEELSIGDYVLTNGVLAAAVISDAVVRLIPGVLGGEGSTESESFSTGLLEGAQYTRPAEFRGMQVPKVLLSGDHAKIENWRQEQSQQKTEAIRPDLLDHQ